METPNESYIDVVREERRMARRKREDPKVEALRSQRSLNPRPEQVVEAFGFSRPSLYEAARAVEAEGLAGLVPARPGPRRAHKLTGEVVAFVEARLAADPALRVRDLVTAIDQRFGVSVHPRSIERALVRAHHPKSGGR
jgi:transposase